MAKSKTTVEGMTGWVILHPDGSAETDYFAAGDGTWHSKGGRVSRQAWMRTYRPGCQIVRATLTWSTSRDGEGAKR